MPISPAGPAGDLQVAGGDPGDLAEAQGDDGQVVGAEPQGRPADDDPGHHGEGHGQGDGQPEIDARNGRGGRQDAGGVRAHGEKGGVAQVQKAGVAHHDVQAQGQNHVETRRWT